MKLENTSQEFRKRFLLIFMREVLKNSFGTEIFELESWEKNKGNKELREKVREKLAVEPFNLPTLHNLGVPRRINLMNAGLMQKPEENFKGADLNQYNKSRDVGFKDLNLNEEKPFEEFKPEDKKTMQNIPLIHGEKSIPPISIPPAKLPSHLHYIKPVPKQLTFDLGKLNPLVKDMMVRAIECNGPNAPLFVLGRMGRKKTELVLTKDEIESILNDFAEFTKIPLEEGVYRVAVGNLLLSAIISSVSEPRFVLSKITPLQNF